MIIRKISIPFDARKTQGVLTVPILSQKEFCQIAIRIEKVSLTMFHKAKPLFYRTCEYSHIFFPLRTTLNQLLSGNNGGLYFICENHWLWLGFIPFPDPVQYAKSSFRMRQKLMHHYRLDDLENLKRLNVSKNKVALFKMPKDAKLQQNAPDQLCSILNLSFLLMVNYEKDKCSLVCCNGPLPPAPFVPILCRKQEILDVKDASIAQAKSLAVSFLAGKQSGIIHFPILLLDQWNIEMKKRPPKSESKVLMQSIFIAFPLGASFDPQQKLKGFSCALTQNSNSCLEIGFFPTENRPRSKWKLLEGCFSTLLETVPFRSKNHYLPDDACSSVILPSPARLKAGKDITTVELKGCSLFLLASEDGHTCGLFHMVNDFELKCIRPTDSEGGVFPIGRLLEQSPSDAPSEKRARVKELGESSKTAVEESKRAVEARRAKRPLSQPSISKPEPQSWPFHEPIIQPSTSRPEPQPDPPHEPIDFSIKPLDFSIKSLESQPFRSRPESQPGPSCEPIDLSRKPLALQSSMLMLPFDKGEQPETSRSPFVGPPEKKPRREDQKNRSKYR